MTFKVWVTRLFQGQLCVWNKKAIVVKTINGKTYRGMALGDTVPAGKGLINVPELYEGDLDVQRSIEVDGEASVEKHVRGRKKLALSSKQHEDGSLRIGSGKPNAALTFIQAPPLRAITDSDALDEEKEKRASEKTLLQCLKGKKKAEDKANRLEERATKARQRLDAAKIKAAAAKAQAKAAASGDDTTTDGEKTAASGDDTDTKKGSDDEKKSKSSFSGSSSSDSSESGKSDAKTKETKAPTPPPKVEKVTIGKMSRDLTDAVKARDKCRKMLADAHDYEGLIKIKVGPLRKLHKVVQTRIEGSRLPMYPQPEAGTNVTLACVNSSLLECPRLQNLVLHLGAFETILGHLDAILTNLKKGMPAGALLNAVRTFYNTVDSTVFVLPNMGYTVVQKLIDEALHEDDFIKLRSHLSEDSKSLFCLSAPDLGVVCAPDLRMSTREKSVNKAVKAIFGRIESMRIEPATITVITEFVKPFIAQDGTWRSLFRPTYLDALQLIYCLATRKSATGGPLTMEIFNFHELQQSQLIPASSSEQGKFLGAYAAAFEIEAQLDAQAKADVDELKARALIVLSKYSAGDDDSDPELSLNDLEVAVEFARHWAAIFYDARGCKAKCSASSVALSTEFNWFEYRQSWVLDVLTKAAATTFDNLLRKFFALEGTVVTVGEIPDAKSPALLMDFEACRLERLTCPLDPSDTAMAVLATSIKQTMLL